MLCGFFFVMRLKRGQWSGEFSESAETRGRSLVAVPDETRGHTGDPTQVTSHKDKAHTHKQHITLIWSKCFIKSKLKASFAVHFVTRHLLSAGLDRRRQLGDIEFSNKYAEFLRSKAKHSSICSFLRRMQSVKMRCEAWPHILTPLDTITNCTHQTAGLKCRDAPWWPNSPSH